MIVFITESNLHSLKNVTVSKSKDCMLNVNARFETEGIFG